MGRQVGDMSGVAGEMREVAGEMRRWEVGEVMDGELLEVRG